MVGVVLKRDTAKEERHDSREGEAGGKEVASVSAERDEAALDLWEVVEMRVFEEERHEEAKCDPKERAESEGK